MKAVILTVTGRLDCPERISYKQQERGEAGLPAMWSHPEHNFV